MLYSMLYNMLRCYIAPAYNMLYDIQVYAMQHPFYNTPCYISVFACYVTHSHSTCYIAPSHIAPLYSIPYTMIHSTCYI